MLPYDPGRPLPLPLSAGFALPCDPGRPLPVPLLLGPAPEALRRESITGVFTSPDSFNGRCMPGILPRGWGSSFSGDSGLGGLLEAVPPGRCISPSEAAPGDALRPRALGEWPAPMVSSGGEKGLMLSGLMGLRAATRAAGPGALDGLRPSAAAIPLPYDPGRSQVPAWALSRESGRVRSRDEIPLIWWVSTRESEGPMVAPDYTRPDVSPCAIR